MEANDTCNALTPHRPFDAMKKPRRIRTSRLYPLSIVLIGVATTSLAQTPSQDTLPPIVVEGKVDDRGEDNLLRVVITRREIERFGDTSLAGVLARVPGVSVTTGRSDSVDIRMRGLGPGHLQMLLNGSILPPGQSLTNLSSDLIERVEVQRVATADSSGQGVAGSINVVLRRSQADAPTVVRARAGGFEALRSIGASVDTAGRIGVGQGSVVINVDRERNVWPSVVEVDQTRASPAPTLWRNRIVDTVESQSLGITPRFMMSETGDRSLSVDGLLQVRRSMIATRESADVPLGAGPRFLQSTLDIKTNVERLRLGFLWREQLRPGWLTEVSGNLAAGQRSSDELLAGALSGDAPTFFRGRDIRIEDVSRTAKGKVVLSLARHDLIGGWDVQRIDSRNRLRQRETSLRGEPIQDLDSHYATRIDRYALFGQDEWKPWRGFSLNTGVRWESVSIGADGGAGRVTTTKSVLSPSLQSKIRLLDASGKEGPHLFRVAIARTYKTPIVRELLPDRRRENNNSATTPDFEGNPGLRPELALGLDLAYERHAMNGGFAAVQGFVRRIKDVVVPQLALEGGVWIERPMNLGQAWVYGLEVEFKGNLRSLLPQGPGVDGRVSIAGYASRLDGIPGPSNRLITQSPFIAKADATWRISNVTAVGSSVSVERSADARTQPERVRRPPRKCTLDAFIEWTVSPFLRWKLSGNNLTGTVETTRYRYQDAALVEYGAISLQTARTIRLQADWRM